jgi:hypothetical protein
MPWTMYAPDEAEDHASEGSDVFLNTEVQAVVVIEGIPVPVPVIGIGYNLNDAWGVFVYSSSSQVFYSFDDEALLTILVKE